MGSWRLFLFPWRCSYEEESLELLPEPLRLLRCLRCCLRLRLPDSLLESLPDPLLESLESLESLPSLRLLGGLGWGGGGRWGWGGGGGGV